MPGYTAGTWFGLSTTAGTPRDVVMKINADVRQVIAEPAIQEQFVNKQLYEPMTSSPEEFAAVHQVRNRSDGARSSASRTCRSHTETQGGQAARRMSHSRPFQPMQTASPTA